MTPPRKYFGFMIWHMNRSPYVIAHVDTMKDVRDWFKEHPEAIPGYYEVTGAFYHSSHFMQGTAREEDVRKDRPDRG